MKQGDRFHLSTDLLGILVETNTTTTLPEGVVVSVVAVPEDAQRMVDVGWSNKIVRVFVQDLEERGQRIAATFES